MFCEFSPLNNLHSLLCHLLHLRDHLSCLIPYVSHTMYHIPRITLCASSLPSHIICHLLYHKQILRRHPLLGPGQQWLQRTLVQRTDRQSLLIQQVRTGRVTASIDPNDALFKRTCSIDGVKTFHFITTTYLLIPLHCTALRFASITVHCRNSTYKPSCWI